MEGEMGTGDGTEITESAVSCGAIIIIIFEEEEEVVVVDEEAGDKGDGEDLLMTLRGSFALDFCCCCN